MPQLLHNGSLLKEGLWLHGTRFQSFNCHWCRPIPEAFVYLPKLAPSEAPDEGDGVTRDLPHVLGLVGQVDLRLLQSRARRDQVNAKSIRVFRVIVHQLIEGGEDGTSCDEEATLIHAADAVMFDRIPILDGQGVVPRLALALSHKERATDLMGTKKLFCLSSFYWTKEPPGEGEGEREGEGENNGRRERGRLNLNHLYSELGSIPRVWPTYMYRMTLPLLSIDSSPEM